MELEAFYDEYVDKVYKFFYIKSLNKALAEDLTSQTFIAYMEKASSIEINQHKQYLYGIMRTVWITFLQKKYAESISYFEDIDNFEDFAEQEITTYESKESINERLLVFIKKLPKKQQSVVSMRLIDGLSNGEIAEALGKNKGYVKTTYQRGLKRLREYLQHPYMEVSHE